MYKTFVSISQKVGIPTKKILDIFYLLRNGKPIANSLLLRTVGISKNALNQVKELLPHVFEETSRDTKIKSSLVQKIKNLFPNEYMPEEKLFSVLQNTSYTNVRNLLQKNNPLRPKQKREYDQFNATIETTAKRAALLDFFADIEGKRLLFLGDDDLTSVACSYISKPEKIMALDIDERILETIRQISRNNNLQIETAKYDARELLPREYSTQFDVVFTDPPYTTEGITLFVSRAIDALDKQNQSGRIYVCYGNSDKAKERFVQIYKVLTDSGLMVRWVFDKFNRYTGAESIGSTSTLIVCELTPLTKSLITGKYGKQIYTAN